MIFSQSRVDQAIEEIKRQSQQPKLSSKAFNEIKEIYREVINIGVTSLNGKIEVEKMVSYAK